MSQQTFFSLFQHSCNTHTRELAAQHSTNLCSHVCWVADQKQKVIVAALSWLKYVAVVSGIFVYLCVSGFLSISSTPCFENSEHFRMTSAWFFVFLGSKNDSTCTFLFRWLSWSEFMIQLNVISIVHTNGLLFLFCLFSCSAFFPPKHRHLVPMPTVSERRFRCSGMETDGSVSSQRM